MPPETTPNVDNPWQFGSDLARLILSHESPFEVVMMIVVVLLAGVFIYAFIKNKSVSKSVTPPPKNCECQFNKNVLLDFEAEYKRNHESAYDRQARMLETMNRILESNHRLETLLSNFINKGS